MGIVSCVFTVFTGHGSVTHYVIIEQGHGRIFLAICNGKLVFLADLNDTWLV